MGVKPKALGAFGFSVKGAKICTISVCPKFVAIKIGVHPSGFGALGLSHKGARISTISADPKMYEKFVKLNLIHKQLLIKKIREIIGKSLSYLILLPYE